jgi:hypothetical protein
MIKAASFYGEERGDAAAVLPRSEQKDKSEEEIEILRNLSTRYAQPGASHRLCSIKKTSVTTKPSRA